MCKRFQMLKLMKMKLRMQLMDNASVEIEFFVKTKFGCCEYKFASCHTDNMRLPPPTPILPSPLTSWVLFPVPTSANLCQLVPTPLPFHSLPAPPPTNGLCPNCLVGEIAGHIKIFPAVEKYVWLIDRKVMHAQSTLNFCNYCKKFNFCDTFVVTIPLCIKINSFCASIRLHTIQFLQRVMCQKEPVTTAALTILARDACQASKTKMTIVR